MVQHRHWLEPFQAKSKPIKLDTNVRVNSSAKEILLKHEPLRLSGYDEYTFKDLILNIWSLLEFLIDQNITSDQNMQGTSINNPLREYLNGWEFRAVVEERSPFRKKQTKLKRKSGGWPQLVQDIDALVLLADGFEDIIVPADEGNEGLCRLWQRLPTGLDYLATSTEIVKDLYDVAGCRLSRNYLSSTELQWYQGDSVLFDACLESNACRCNRLQQIFPKSAGTKIPPPKHIVDKGAVIFGHPGTTIQNLILKTSAQIPTKWGIYSRPNAPLTPIQIGQDSEDSASSDCDIQDCSGCSLTVKSTPASLSSCTTLATQSAPSEICDVEMGCDWPVSSRERLQHRDTHSEILDEAPSPAGRERAKIEKRDSPCISPLPRCYDDSADVIGQRSCQTAPEYSGAFERRAQVPPRAILQIISSFLITILVCTFYTRGLVNLLLLPFNYYS
jgi:hypothetical protein